MSPCWGLHEGQALGCEMGTLQVKASWDKRRRKEIVISDTRQCQQISVALHCEKRHYGGKGKKYYKGLVVVMGKMIGQREALSSLQDVYQILNANFQDVHI